MKAACWCTTEDMITERQRGKFINERGVNSTVRHNDPNAYTPNTTALETWRTGYLPKVDESICLHRKQYARMYSTFMHNFQTNQIFGEYKTKWWYIQTMEYCLAIKKDQPTNTQHRWISNALY